MDILNRLLARIVRWRCRAAQRRALRRLDDRLLDDVGLDRATAEREARRMF
ncbi:MAG: DUF1127 domain-containing protein [Rhodobacterales bacterium]|nr:DUF1127 domain-containing protein [Rhodobacterales bacterium]